MSAHPPAGQITLVLLASTAMVAVFAPLTKLKAVADANLIVRPAADGEVLTELSVLEVAAAKLTLPVLIGVQLMYEHRAAVSPKPRSRASYWTQWRRGYLRTLR